MVEEDIDADAPADEELQSDEPGDPPGDEAETQDDSQADAEDEVIVTIGEESPTSEDAAPQQDSSAIRALREANRKHRERIRQLELAQTADTTATQVAAVGEKPKLEDCEYDTEKFETALTAWHERKRVADDEAAKKRTAAENEARAWQQRLDHHSKLKTELKVKDFDEAEAEIEAAFSVTQRGLIVHGADNSAVLYYALGKNPKKLKELAAITDPVKFAFAVAKLETQLKVTTKKAPIPERTLRGNASVSGAVDNQLERLRAEAAKTGDMTKVIAYKKAQKDKRKA